MCLKHIFGVFRAQRTCLVAAGPTGKVNSASPNPLARFERSLQCGKRKRDKERKGRGEISDCGIAQFHAVRLALAGTDWTSSGR